MSDDQPIKSGPGGAERRPGKSLRHDMRTPLSQIIGYAELLEEDAQAASQDRAVEDLKKIQVAARRLIDMIDQHVPPAAQVGTMLVLPGAEPAAGAAPAVEGAAGAPPATQTAAATKPAVAPTTTATSEARLNLGVAPPSGRAESSVSLLVVDDIELNRDMLARRLRRQGYAVETAEDGYRALERLERQHFDLVLLDIMMPGLSGYDVLKKVRETRAMSELPVIMATAKDQGEDIVEALKLGANDYVTKPLDFQVVMARVKTQLALKDAMEEVRRLAQSLEVHNRFIRKTFGRYLSDDIVAGLLETPNGLALGGEKRTVTVLMSDIRGFSAISERLAPEQVVRILNRYLGAMAEIITRQRGTIDEFIGDAILTLFGAPTLGGDDAARAVACAIEMQLGMAAVNEENHREGLPALQMGIAINTGEVVVGNIGSETRAKYGVVGSPVNLTSRIESCTLGGQVFVAQTTVDAVGPALEIGSRMTMDVKGFAEPIVFYEVKRLGAPWNLDLPSRRAKLVTLVSPIAVHFSVLEGKHISTNGQRGMLTRLGDGVAEIQAEQLPRPLTDLRMRVTGHDGQELPHDVYAKVLDGAPAGAFTIGFTMLPPEVVALLETVRPATGS